MYIVDKNKNSIQKIQQASFSELGFRERENLQEWIAANPSCLGEDLLIVQKEFSGFSDTSERLDLLALDKKGNLVVIENKLDDSGRDVTWQALKYASYCSSLTKNQIFAIYQQYLAKEGRQEAASENIVEFLETSSPEEILLNQGTSQRIILVAANFRKEVTSTVIWLMNYKLRIQCFKVTPYTHNNETLLDVEQIIPLHDSEEYLIGMADKAFDDAQNQEKTVERYGIRIDFWNQYLTELNKISSIYRDIRARKESAIGTGAGVAGVAFNSVISNYYARVELYISRADQAENKKLFDLLAEEKDSIEKKIGTALVWERMDDKKASRIKIELPEVDYFNRETWDSMIQFLCANLPRFAESFAEPLKKASAKMRIVT